MTTQEIGKRYVTLCQQGKGDVCLDELYAKSAVSVEAATPPGVERTAKGLDAIRAKEKETAEFCIDVVNAGLQSVLADLEREVIAELELTLDRLLRYVHVCSRLHRREDDVRVRGNAENIVLEALELKRELVQFRRA